jgi:outer membrane beta-barrel protein
MIFCFSFLVGSFALQGEKAFAQKGKSAPSAPAATTPPTAPAAAPAAPDAAKPNDKKLDISDLENKYWAPKDTDFSVVQNRTYPKEKKFFISPEYGVMVNDQYSEGSVFGLTGNYFFSERYGIQLQFLKANLHLNDAMKNLVNLSSGVQPNHGQFTGLYAVGFDWVPFYAKMSVLGKRIIYFDMSVTPYVGISTYDQILETGNKGKSGMTVGLDVSQYFLFSKWVAIRTDIKYQLRQEDVAVYHGNNVSTVTGQKVGSTKWSKDTIFLVGAMFFW